MQDLLEDIHGLIIDKGITNIFSFYRQNKMNLFQFSMIQIMKMIIQLN